jgi:hypothetical protein
MTSRIGRVWCGLAAAATLWGPLLLPMTAAKAASPAYLTLLFSHSAWTLTENCVPVTTGVMTPDRIGRQFQQRGLVPTGTVVTGWVAQHSRTCIENLPLYPVPKPIEIDSWDDIASLASTYGWRFVSHSVDYANMTQLTKSQQQHEACDSLAALQAHGRAEARGLFAYPNNFYTTAINTNVVLPCGYVAGRKYGGGAMTPSTLASSRLVNTDSVNGGACNDASLPCYGLSTPRRYTSPSQISARMQPTAGTWSVVQVYRLVTGSKLSGKSQWDCTATNWRAHWTAGVDPTELYCWKDYLSALNHIPSGVITTDPLTVEQAWGLAG